MTTFCRAVTAVTAVVLTAALGLALIAGGVSAAGGPGDRVSPGALVRAVHADRAVRRAQGELRTLTRHDGIQVVPLLVAGALLLLALALLWGVVARRGSRTVLLSDSDAGAARARQRALKRHLIARIEGRREVIAINSGVRPARRGGRVSARVTIAPGADEEAERAALRDTVADLLGSDTVRTRTSVRPAKGGQVA